MKKSVPLLMCPCPSYCTCEPRSPTHLQNILLILVRLHTVIRPTLERDTRLLRRGFLVFSVRARTHTGASLYFPLSHTSAAWHADMRCGERVADGNGGNSRDVWGCQMLILIIRLKNLRRKHFFLENHREMCKRRVICTLVHFPNCSTIA